jgi:RIO kinase 1
MKGRLSMQNKSQNFSLSEKQKNAFLIIGARQLMDSLVPYDEIAPFFDEGFITDVLFPVKRGKEATVYCAKAHPDRAETHYALKYYRPLSHRSFRNDAIYQEGRFGRETREVRAMRTKTKKGRMFQFQSWVAHEYAMLSALKSAGVDVARPIAVANSSLLIEFIGEDGIAAPLLSSIRLNPEEAREILQHLLASIELMLACHVVHSDLSAYNVLYWQGRPTIIDLPQAVNARTNPNARQLLVHDVAQVCRYFARQGVASNANTIADELWERYAHARL